MSLTTSSVRTLRVHAPTNIALIKYMGKTASPLNLPENGSLSLTLSQLGTEVELRYLQAYNSTAWGSFAQHFRHQPQPDPKFPIDWNAKTLQKLDRHWVRIQAWAESRFSAWELPVRTPVEWAFSSHNTFPSDAGIASSASSFAAFTLAFALALCDAPETFLDLFKKSIPFRTELASLARQGSGSACRSFFGPFCQWHSDLAQPIAFDSLPPLTDLIWVIDRTPKAVSSSQAHAQIKTSPLWSNRIERVQQRQERLQQNLQQNQWDLARSEIETEFWDMHSLFHTSDPHFRYLKGRTLEVLDWVAQHRHPVSGLRPWVTLDAGPNPHLIVPTSDAPFWSDLIRPLLQPGELLLSDHQGAGPQAWVE